MLLIINNKSSFLSIFLNKLSEKNFPHIVYKHNEQIDFSIKNEIKGIILSGGPGTPYEPLNLSANYTALNNFNAPIMGICLGHEIISAFFGSKIEKLSEHQKKEEKIMIDRDDAIFKNLNHEIFLQVKHYYHIKNLPYNFIKLAHSEICPFEIIKHIEKPIYGFQSHPEILNKDGAVIMKNFLEICGIELNFNE